MMNTLLPVIHYANDSQAMTNAERAFDAGCDGVFLIHMAGENHLLGPVARLIKARWPDKLVGVNYLGVAPEQAIAANIADGLDMTWTDAQLTHSEGAPWAAADRARHAMASAPTHLLFAGVAFKHQKPEPAPELAAQKAVELGFIPTTSGVATGVAAEADAIAQLKAQMGVGPLAIASGITPENAAQFTPYLTHILVATGVSSSFYFFDFEKLCQLRALC